MVRPAEPKARESDTRCHEREYWHRVCHDRRSAWMSRQAMSADMCVTGAEADLESLRCRDSFYAGRRGGRMAPSGVSVKSSTLNQADVSILISTATQPVQGLTIRRRLPRSGYRPAVRLPTLSQVRASGEHFVGSRISLPVQPLGAQVSLRRSP